ncbi:hypothetical protein, partial [Neobacillus drentensis]|uniref:hypothetical protein n=1 Tax=Neobacillus drentensis TaxID=220684 RepID=UPI003001B574
SGTVQIANGAKLTVEPGVTIIGNEKEIKVFGDFEAVGSHDSKVTFNKVFISSGITERNKPTHINIEYANFNGGSLSIN